jgi:hypothetical protein
MMDETLYLFLLKNQEIAIPGIGTVVLETKPATADFASRYFLPPLYQFSFRPAAATVSKQMYASLAATTGISERDAVMKLNDLAFEWKKILESGREVEWEKVGHFKKVLGGEIRFEPHPPATEFMKGVHAEKMIRQNAEHTMLVGEQEMTSTAMTDMLSLEPAVKSHPWWAWPLAILILLCLFLGWYFSEYGLHVLSSGSQSKISPADAPASYKMVQ